MLYRSDDTQIGAEFPAPVQTAVDMQRGKGVGPVLEGHVKVDDAAGFIYLVEIPICCHSLGVCGSNRMAQVLGKQATFGRAGGLRSSLKPDELKSKFTKMHCTIPPVSW